MDKLILFSLLVGIISAFQGPDYDRVEEKPPVKQMTIADLPKLVSDENCVPGTVDLIFAIDGSGSVGRQNFGTLKQFLKNLVTEMKVDQTKSRVGIIQFTYQSQVEFHLNAHTDQASLLQAIDGITYLSGGTYIAGAMNLAIDEGFLASNGERGDISNVLVVFTDGQDGRIRDVIEAYNRAAEQGDTVLAIGIGNGVNRGELNQVAGNIMSNVFDVSSFTNLTTITGSVCKHIQDLDPCAPDPCNNHGTCHRVGNSTTDYTCSCNAGYHGDNCEGSVCEHGGTFHCTCPFGYTGPTCGEVIDFCNGTDIMYKDGSIIQLPFCGSHGVCQNTAGGAICKCDHGFTGMFCETHIDYCQPNPCRNGGTCKNLDLNEPGYQCFCTDLYHGTNCTLVNDFCKDLEILQNGTVVHVHVCGDHGSCVNTPSGALCICHNDTYAWWDGKFCEVEHPMSCEYKGHMYPHNSTWVDKCDSCACLFGHVECADSYWCPKRCAVFNTTRIHEEGIPLDCPQHQNCIPDKQACTTYPSCDYPIGWCFPVGYVMADSITYPTNPPTGYVPGG